jgi:putative proteasome-type protease
MTYCLALRLNEGLVFMSDTRTNAGLDNVSTFNKMHVFQPAPDRLFVLQSAGNLATTQEVIDRVAVDLRNPGDGGSLATVDHLFEAALYVGRLSQEVSARHRPALSAVGADGTCTFILGGQVGDDPPDILLVYPEGNYIRASDDKPFLQIGETKYGKFMLELAVRSHADLITATKIALGSMLSTARANLSVGPPYDVGVYVTSTHTLDRHRFDADSPVLAELAKLWERHLMQGVELLPYVSLDDLRATVPSDPTHLSSEPR